MPNDLDTYQTSQEDIEWKVKIPHLQGKIEYAQLVFKEIKQNNNQQTTFLGLLNNKLWGPATCIISNSSKIGNETRKRCEDFFISFKQWDTFGISLTANWGTSSQARSQLTPFSLKLTKSCTQTTNKATTPHCHSTMLIYIP